MLGLRLSGEGRDAFSGSAACGVVPHLLLQRRLLPWKALCSCTKGTWNKLSAACPLTAVTRTGCSQRRVFPSERDVFSLLPTCGNGRINYRGSSTLRKRCGWIAASYVAASPRINNLLLPPALAAQPGLCRWLPALSGSQLRAHRCSAPAAVQAGPHGSPGAAADLGRSSLLSYCFF